MSANNEASRVFAELKYLFIPVLSFYCYIIHNYSH